MNTSNKDMAKQIADRIKLKINLKTNDGKISKSTIATSLALHIALEAIAEELDVDILQFKKDCGIGQPLAYFI